MNLHCDKRGCSHNTGFEFSCMYGISEDLIRHAKSGNSMCEHLRKNILELEKLFCKDMAERIVERLEEQAEECRKYWQEFGDEDSFGGMNAYCAAVKIVKEEGGIK